MRPASLPSTLAAMGALACSIGLTGCRPAGKPVAAVRNGPVIWVESDGQSEDSTVKMLKGGPPATLVAHRRNLAVSADGRWMLTQDAALDSPSCAVRLMNLVTRRERVLEGCDGGDAGYKWAPRGSRLTVEDTNTLDELVIDARTGKTIRITDGAADPPDIQTDWSPDGRRLLVMRRDGARLLDARTGRWAPVCGEGDGDAWAPAGRMVLVIDGESATASTTLCTRSGHRMSRLPGTGYSWAGSPSRLVREDSAASGFAVIDRRGRVRWRVRDGSGPVWSSHGRAAYFRDAGEGRTSVWIERANGRGGHQLGLLPPGFPAGQTELSWSPDGRSVGASWFDTESEFHVPEESVIASTRGGGFRRLAGALLSYSPDGRRMALSVRRLEIADASGEHPRAIPGAPAPGRIVEQLAWPPVPR